MEKYIEALKKLPVCRLRLIDLAWEYVKEDGTPDEDKLLFHHDEVSQAIREAQGHIADTKKAVKNLCDLALLNRW